MPKGKPKVTTSEANRLYRSESDRMIAGVCAGIADYFGIDANLIRILFITITLFGGAGLLLYILLWIVIPTESATQKAVPVTVSHSNSNKRGWFGLIVALLGLYFLLANFGWVAWLPLDRLWPVVIIFVGLNMIGKQSALLRQIVTLIEIFIVVVLITLLVTVGWTHWNIPMSIFKNV